jgi:hypothetical protein
LSQRRAKRQGEGWRIAVQLALVNGRPLVPVKKFNWIFDGQDVAGLVLIHLVQDCRQRGLVHGVGASC